jgi:hypothetical protein
MSSELIAKLHSGTGRGFKKFIPILNFGNFLTVLLTLLFALWMGKVVSNYARAAIAVSLFIIVVPFIWKWRIFGILFAIVTSCAVIIPEFNISNIPILGWCLASLPIRERLSILAGGFYLFFVLIKSLRKREQFNLIPFIPIALLLFYGYLVASTFAVFAGQEEINWFFNTILFGVILFLIIYTQTNTAQKARILIYALILANLVFSLGVLFFSKSVISYDPANYGRLGGSGWMLWLLPLGFSMGANSVYISTYMGLSIVLTWGEILNSGLRLRLVLIAILFFLVRTLILTGARTGIYGTMIGIFILTALNIINQYLNINKHTDPEQNKSITALNKRTILIIILFTTIIALGTWGFTYYANSNSHSFNLVNRIINPVGDDNTQARIYFYTVSLRQSFANPLGPGTLDLHTVTGLNHHSFYTLIIAGLGWFGFFCLVWLIGWCFWKIIKGFMNQNEDLRYLSITILTGFITLFIMGFGHPVVGPTWGTTMFWTILGLTASSKHWLYPAS